MRLTCERCGGTFQKGARGPAARFCSSRCRVAAHRAKAPVIPKALTYLDRWTRAAGKRPLTASGASASSTKRETWSSFAEVRKSKVGNGFGFMLGAGVGCYDLDGTSDAAAREFIASIPESVIYVERSMSGKGVHVFARIPESRGSLHRNADGSTVERYSFGRFIRMTGVPFV